MPTKISRGTQRRIGYVMGDLESIAATSGRISEEAVTTLFCRAAIPSQPDGFPVSTALDTKSSGGTPGNSPTVGAAFARNGEWNGKSGRSSEDPIQKQARRFEEYLKDAAVAVRNALGVLNTTKIQVEKARGRATTEPCMVCQELPAEKMGMCLKDYHHWCDYGRPDRQAWIAFKRQLRNKEDLLLVIECPLPGPGNQARRGPHKA